VVFLLVSLILFLGVASTGAVMALAERILLRPVPFPAPDRLVALRTIPLDAPPATRIFFPESYENLRDLQDATTAIELHGWYLGTSFQMGEDGRLVEIQGAGIRESYFDALGLPPALGRFPTARELERGDPVVVLSHRFWLGHFGGSPGALGQNLRLGGRNYEVAAVLRPRAGSPTDADVLVPLELNERQRTERSLRILFHLGRLRDGVSITQAQADYERAADQLRPRHPAVMQNWKPHIEPFTRLYIDGQDRTVSILTGASFLLLLLAMLNLGSLVLAQAAQRSQETAVRLALGATPRDVARQALAQTALATLPGTIAGLLGAWWLTPRLGLLNPNPYLAHLYDGLELNPVVAAATGSISMLLALLAGLLPVWQNLTVPTAGVLRESTRGGGSSPRVLRTQRWLIRGQLALTSAFLVLGGFLGLSYARLRQADQGFAVENRIAATYSLPANRYGTEGAFRQFARALQDRLGERRIFTQAAITTNLPVGDLVWSTNFAPAPRGNEDMKFELHLYSRISETFTATGGLRLISGRNFTVDDRGDTPPVALVSQSAARHFWPGAAATGQTLVRRRGNNLSPPIQVVGVVSDAVVGGPRNGVRPVVYLPVTQSTPASALTVLVESPLGAAEVVAEIKSVVADLDPALAVAQVSPLRERYDNTVSVERFQTRLLAAMGAVCLLITALGVYGLIERQSKAREVEFAVRTALGAGMGEHVRLHLREQGLLVLSAVGPGLLVASFVAHRVDLGLFAITARHPLPYGAAALLVAGLVLLSLIGPLRRILRAPVAQLLRK